MPTYEYACRSCEERLEVVQSFSDDPLTVCEACGGELRKVFSAAGLIFKGSGWHIKDYSSSAKSTSSASGTSGDAQTSAADTGSTQSEGTKSEGTKSEAKSEGKSTSSSKPSSTPSSTPSSGD
jgi:putative FmdB family regulatory protein